MSNDCKCFFKITYLRDIYICNFFKNSILHITLLFNEPTKSKRGENLDSGALVNVLTIGSLGKKLPWFVAFADFHGVNIPTMTDSK